MWRNIVLFILVSTVVWAAPVAAQTPPLDLATYEALLREARAAAARGDGLDLEQVAPTLVGATAVRMPDGALVPVDNRWLATELERPNPNLSPIAERLGALIDALALPAPPAPADAPQRLEAILAGPPFDVSADAPREPGPLERFFEWLFERLGQLLEPVVTAAGGEPGTVASWVIIGVAAILILFVLTLWLRGLRRTLGTEMTHKAPPVAQLSRADARAQAEALARAGDYRGAARLLALTALLWLDERGVLRYDPHQTNREHLGRLREQPVVRANLTPIVDTADRIWYGGQALDAAGYAEYARRVDTLREEV